VFGNGRMVRRCNYLDKQARSILLRKQKVENILKINDLSKKYLPLEEFRKIAPTSIVFFNCGPEIPLKGTKAYERAVTYFHNSLINVSNLIQTDEKEPETMIQFFERREAELLVKA